MIEHRIYDEKLKKNMQEIIAQSVAAGTILGFLIGLVVASFLHKYIVHPFGW